MIEDHGCSSWFWMPDNGIEEGVKWWKDQDSVEVYYYPGLLPGVTVQVRGDLCSIFDEYMESGQFYSAGLNEDYWSEMIAPDGERVHHRNYELAVELAK